MPLRAYGGGLTPPTILTRLHAPGRIGQPVRASSGCGWSSRTSGPRCGAVCVEDQVPISDEPPFQTLNAKRCPPSGSRVSHSSRRKGASRRADCSIIPLGSGRGGRLLAAPQDLQPAVAPGAGGSHRSPCRQQRIQPRRPLLLHAGQDVRIGIQRQRDRRVPEHLLYDLRRPFARWDVGLPDSLPAYRVLHGLSGP